MLYRLIRHSFLQVTGNLKIALLHSIPLVVLYFALTLFVGRLFATSDVTEFEPRFGILWVLGPLAFFAFLWLAVNFHIAILTPNERPSIGERIGRSFGYLGRSFLIGLVILIPLIIVLVIFAALTGGVLMTSGSIAIVGELLIGAVFGWLAYRLSPILPAGAIGNPIGLGPAWDATRALSGVLFAFAVLVVIANFIFGLLIATLLWSVYSIVSPVVDWFILMIGISVYTTLYGVAIEDRELV